MYQALINQNELLCRCAQWLNTGAQEVMSNIWLIVSFERKTTSLMYHDQNYSSD